MKKLLILGWLLLIVGIAIGQTTIDNGDTGLEVRTVLNNNIHYFNVKDFGAVGDGVTDDTDSIQACIDSAIVATGTYDGAIIYCPMGTYLISDSLVIANANRITLCGDGRGSVIYSTASSDESTLRLRDGNRFTVRDIVLMGNGSAFGAGATNGSGMELYHATYSNFINVTFSYNGWHGSYALNGSWGIKYNNCEFYGNKLDGINAVDDDTQENTGANGNGMAIVECIINANGDDGIEWASAQALLSGSTIEDNKGSGLQIGSLASTEDADDFTVIGNYFEGNDSSQIKIITAASPSRPVDNVIIEGNRFNASNTIGDTTIIAQICGSGTYNQSFRASRIGNNYMVSGSYVTWNIYLEDAHRTTVVEYNAESARDFTMDDAGSIRHLGHDNYQPYSYSVTTGGITDTYLYPVFLIAGSGGPIDVTADPQIIDGLFNGQEITLIGSSNTNTVTWDDGTGLALDGDAQFVMGEGDVIILKYIESLDIWIEITRSNN